MLLLTVVFYSVAGFLGLRCVLVTLDRLSGAIGQAHSTAMETVSGPKPSSNVIAESTDPAAEATAGGIAPAGPPGSVASPETRQAAEGPAGFAPPFLDIPAVPQNRLAAIYGSQPQQVSVTPAVRSSKNDVITVFRIWIMVFGLVGAQMAWVLRPFLGSPHAVFTWFRPRSSNFFEAVIYALQHLFK